ncbi:MAG TPA: hypothetical protein PK816_17555, partial [Candidatus Cloacimonadota bacterium]|nr:hypothetical protein [Candidatus Cloacimonadota bacterium]
MTVRKIVMILVVLLATIQAGSLNAQSIVGKDSIQMSVSRVDTLSTVNSFSKVGHFFKMDYQGDYETIVQNLNASFIGGAYSSFSDFNCSLFSTTGDSLKYYYGRNFDNPECDVLMGRYTSPGKYTSLAFCRISDLGLPMTTDYTNMTETQKKKLLKSPFFAADGMNECGLAAGLAYVPSVTYTPNPEKQTIF